MKNNQNYIKLILQWILLQINYTIAELNKILRGDARHDLHNVRLSLLNARLQIEDALHNTKDAHEKKGKSKNNWDTFIRNDANLDELIWLSNVDLEEIMQKYSLKKRAAYNWRKRSRLELREFPLDEFYPKRKFRIKK